MANITQGRNRAALIVLLSLVGGILLVTGTVWVVLGGLPYVPPAMRDTFTGLEGVTAVEENTAQLCAAVPCVEAWQTGVGAYLRFATDDLAEYWSIVIGGDTHRNGTVVLDMNGLKLTQDERELAVQLLFPGRDWS